MPSKRGRRAGGPNLPGHRRPTRPPPHGRDEDEPELLTDIRSLLAEPGPFPLLALASSMLAALDPRRVDPFTAPTDDPSGGVTTADLVASFLESDEVETTALLTALVELLPADADEILVRRIRRELARRHHTLPSWLTGLAPFEVPRAMVMAHVLGDGDNVMLEVRTGAGDALTAVVYIDHNLGTLVKDAFVVEGTLTEVVDQFREAADGDPDTTFADLDRADARTRIEAAIEIGAITYPPFETETWPASRPVVERILRELPGGGTGYVRPTWSDEDRAALVERFVATPYGHDHADDDGRDLLESLLWFGCDYGPGDPLRWSPVAVELLLADWLPRKVVAPAAFLSRAPDVLRALIRFSHAERGLPEELTRETLAAVDAWEPDYLAAIGDPTRPTGPEALLAGLLDASSDPGHGVLGLLDPYDHDAWVRDSLHEIVGGADALRDLDDMALPDEAFAWGGVPTDVHERVAEVLDLTDSCCDDLFDVEHRTACRRLLADVAARDPAIFRRKARPDTGAAAIVWSVAKANSSFQSYAGGLTAKALLGWFGLSGSVSQRAATMLRAIGVDTAEQYGSDLRLGTPRYLVSGRRRGLLERRDRLEASGTDG